MLESNENSGPSNKSKNLDTNDVNHDVKTTDCGMGSFRPKLLQNFLSPEWLLFCLCWASTVQGIVVNGFVNAVVTTIEKRFSLSSKYSGMVASGYAMGSIVGLLPTAYLGGKPSASKPRWLAAGITSLSIGSLVFAMPHLVYGTYAADRFDGKDVTICNPDAIVSSRESDCLRGKSLTGRYPWSLAFFMGGQALHGLGAAPLYTLGVTFLDESVDAENSSFYLGIFYTMALIGPAVGFLMGNVFLKIYVDVGKVDSNSLGLTPESSLWVGAWWMGFVLSGILGLLIAIPLLAFPPSFPGTTLVQSLKVSEVHLDAKKSLSKVMKTEDENILGTSMAIDSLSKIPALAQSLFLTNPPYVLLCLAGGIDAMLLNGLAAFLPKYLESQFSWSKALAALSVGAVCVPGGGGGTFLGGYIIKKYQMRCSSIIRMCTAAAFLSFLFLFVFAAYCPNVPMVGINTNYPPKPASTKPEPEKLKLDSWCNADCKCSPSYYDPVCATGRLQFYSPCYAGCTVKHQSQSVMEYANCSCIQDKLLRTVHVEERVMFGTASRKNCASECSHLVPIFLTLLLLTMLFTFLTSIPSLSATLRCVESEQRSLSLGIQWMVFRLIGSIPGPIIFGAVVDQACTLWQSDCGNIGNCQSYSNELLSRYIFFLVIFGKGATVVFFLLAWKLYKQP